MESLLENASPAVPHREGKRGLELPDRNTVPTSTYLELIITMLLNAVNSKDRQLTSQATRRYFTPEVQVDRASEPFVR